MADTTLDIHLKIHRDQAKAAIQEEIQSYKQVEKAADHAAKSVEQAAKQESEARRKATKEALTDDEIAARAREELIRRENQARIKAAADAADVAKQAADAVKAAERESADAAKRASRERTQAARDEAAARKVALKDARDAELKVRKEQADAVKKVRDESRKAAAEEREQSKQQSEGLSKVTAIGGQVANVFGAIGSAAYGLNGISSIIQMIADSFERARNQAEGAGKFANAYKEALKEIAYLKGQPGPTNATVFEDLAFRGKTLQDQSGARSLQEEFRNMAGVSIDSKDTKRKMSEADAQTAMIFAGQMQSMYGGEGGAYGKLAGIIPSVEKSQRVTGEDVSRRYAQLMQLGQMGGASPSQFAEQMAGSAALVTSGGYKDISRMAAVGSTLSLESPKEISTGLDQIHRLTQGSLKDQTAPPGAEMTPAAYLASLGATDQMDDAEILELMMSDVENKQAQAKSQGKELNVTTYLQSRGYANIQDRGRFAQMFGRRNDYRNTFSKVAGTMTNGQFTPNLPSLEDARKPFGQFMAGEKGMSQQASLSEERVMASQGLGAQEYYQALEKQAFAILSQRGEISGTYDDWKGSPTVSAEMGNILRQEGIRSGLDLAPKVYDYGRSQHVDDPMAKFFVGQAGSKDRADAFYGLAQQISAKGGSAMGMNSDDMKQFQASLDKTAKATEAASNALQGINQKLDPAPVATVPPGGRNAGPTR